MEDHSRASSSDREAILGFSALVLLASGNAVAIRFSNRELDPLWGASLRFAMASAVLLLLMVGLRKSWPRGHQLSGSVVFGGLGLGVTFGLTYQALQEIQAGMAQTLLALVPLVTLLIAVTWRQEALSVRSVLGALLALGGIAVITQAPVTSVSAASVLAMLGAVTSMSLSAVVVRRFPPVDPVAMNAVAALTAMVLLLAASFAAGETHSLPASSRTWVAVTYLAVIGSVAVFTLYLLVLKHWSASRAAYSFVLIPVFTITLSAWLDDEQIGAGLLVGALLVLGGVYLGALRAPGPRPSLESEQSRTPVQRPQPYEAGC